MGARRTRKQKEGVRHPFLVSWDPDSGMSVKRKTKEARASEARGSISRESANNLGNNEVWSLVKPDILKSIFLAGLIFSLELVLYFWLK